jgi:para-aminobenzoate synthetase/4-amino-4-deoxychorismate lyase
MDALTRPDPARGLFETLLVVEGEPVELEAHLERLAGGLEAVFGAELSASLGDQAAARANGLSLGRLRIDVAVAAGGGPRATMASEAVDSADVFPVWERGSELASALHPGGLGPFKWADRRALAEGRPGKLRLLLDRGDEVLEASRANLFAVFGAELATPRADGRILPGIARAGAIAAARDSGVETVERSLWRTELLTADEVFLTGSVRGVEPVRALDGTPLAGPGPLSRRVGEELRRRWFRAPLAAAAPAPAGEPRPGRPAR